MKAKSERLTSARLVLKGLEEGDREALLRMVGDERIKENYMLPDFSDSAQEEVFFRRMRALCASGAHFMYGIYRAGELIGLLNDCEMSGGGVELGYFITPAHWNHGYASEALRAAIDELFRMGYKSATAGYFEGNPASRRVMEKCGMRPLPREEVISYRGTDRRCLYCGIRREVRLENE